jgi:lysozyme
MTQTVSAPGRAALMAREGCRLAAYRDSLGVPTIGVGHTGRAGPPPVDMGMAITRAEADAIFAADLAPFEAAVSRTVAAPLTQNQFDALVSLAFNIGARGFAGSTVVHKLADGDHTGAADAFLMWVHPPELAARRRAERAQFLRPDDPTPAAPAATAAGPHLLPRAAPSLWARIAAAFARKVA